jgi:hypothetical protein
MTARKKRAPARGRRARRTSDGRAPARVAALSAGDLRALRRKIEKQTAVPRWNPDPDDVQRSVVQLVLTLVELIRRLMERQAIRRVKSRTFTKQEAEAVGSALMEIERTVLKIARTFDLTPEDLNLDLSAIKLL